ncbi:hypothetical protein BRD00_00570 [Halobacteriales archaeon QS_8_69_26]|nr:MAG: hypothetical protein BRD00_00570 [Halobacteriales archaeon QS_8_69_26]
MSDVTAESVREAFDDADDGYEVRTVEENRSQFRVLLDEGSVSRDEAEDILEDAFGEGSVFGVGVSDERGEDEGETVRAVSFRVR